MEYIYGAMLLHAAGKKVNEENLKKVLKAAGFGPDASRVKALTASLEGVDIEAALKSASFAPIGPAPAAAEKREEKKEEKKEEKEEVSEEDAAAGLGALFGF
ncbi:MAG: 50S ribosomal protein P1 [Thermoplasmata archaeon]